MTEIQQNRYDQLLRRVADLKGPGSKVNDALTELFPIFDVETLKGELLVLGGVVLGFGASQLTGAAGELAKIQVFNPVGSGQIATVTSVIVGTSTASIMRLAIANAALTTVISTEGKRDLRAPITERPVCQIIQESSAGFANADLLFSIQANEAFPLSDPNDLFVLAPGTGLTVSNSDAQTAIQVSFLWRERPAEPSELSV